MVGVYANDHVLNKMLGQNKMYSAKKFIVEFHSKPGTLSGINKRLFNTGHFMFWVDLTKTTVTVVRVNICY